MSNQADPRPSEDDVGLRSEPAMPDAVESTETYETDEGTVFYDAENPLAWLQVDTPLPLPDMT